MILFNTTYLLYANLLLPPITPPPNPLPQSPPPSPSRDAEDYTFLWLWRWNVWGLLTSLVLPRESIGGCQSSKMAEGDAWGRGALP